MTDHFNFDKLRNLTIGSVDFVSPKEIKVLLETDAPQNTALNTGVPSLFPRINGFVLVPNEVGALVGIISWLGVEHSQYPKRKGFKDYDLIDLPFPLRKMAVNPIGTLKRDTKDGNQIYKLERGVYSFPSIGDSVILPTDQQLKSIVENDDELAFVKIGTAPIAGNATVKINPNKLFGRHVAILGNTGSGKSCSVAGVIRWSLQEASKALHEGQKLNTRFIVLDPNGEYTKSFDDLNCDIKKFKVELSEEEKATFKALKVPAWLWNSYEWSSFSNASGRTQRPILRRALRELRSGETDGLSDFQTKTKSHFSSCYASLKFDLSVSSNYKEESTKFGKKILSLIEDCEFFKDKCDKADLKPVFNELKKTLDKILKSRFASFVNKERETVEYYTAFSREDVEKCVEATKKLLDSFGGITSHAGPSEDAPTPFDVSTIPDRVEQLAQEAGVIQFVDFLVMRMRSMLSDTRMNKIIVEDKEITLNKWLGEVVNGISIIDLSLVPSDITHLIVSVISRIVFESLQRYRRITGKLLPTVIVMEEAHNFIKRYNESSEEITSSQLCTESFERIAREGRKFGLSLTLSSQRPSELSPTVLSQCNTFLLHRIVNDRDQELVKRLVPDNIGGLLAELPILPTKKGILLGWASSLPILVEMNDLDKKYRPKSEDPDFWEVWTNSSDRSQDWKPITDDWQGNIVDSPPAIQPSSSQDVKKKKK